MSRRKIAAALRSVAFLGLCGMAGAQLDPLWNVDLIGRMGGWCWVVELVGPHAYLDEGGSLTILDISDPGAPLPLGHFSFGLFAFNDLRVKDAIAYLAGGTPYGLCGLQILDVSDPARPERRGFCEVPLPPFGVFVGEDIAYVACANPWHDPRGGFQIVDVRNPSSPLLCSPFVPVPARAWKIFVKGGIAYLASLDGLHVFDVKNPSVPTSLGFYAQRRCYDVVVAGQLAYTATDSGLEVVDVTSPTAPASLGGLYTISSSYALALSGSLIYLAQDGFHNIDVADVTDPASPRLVASYRTSGWPWDVAVSGDIACVADGPGGLLILDVADPASPTLQATYDTLSDPTDICVVDGVAYVANGIRGFKTIDVSNPRSPKILGFLALPSPAWAMDASGGLACVCGTKDGHGFVNLIDITSPSSPRLLTSYEMEKAVRTVTLSHSSAFVSTYHELHIFDISDPCSPTLQAVFATPGLQCDVFISGDLAFIADYTNLQIVDISDPASPFLRSSFEPGFRMTYVVVSNGIAYVTGTWPEGDFACVDVSNPDAPTLLGMYDAGIYVYPAGGLSVSNGRAYVLLDALRVIDVSDPTSPRLCGYYPIGRGTFASELVASGDLVYVIHTWGLKIFQFTGADTHASHWHLYR